MDKVHRRELKHDAFVDKVGDSVEYAAEHKTQVAKWGIVVLGVLLVGLGIYFYTRQQREARQDDLRAAMRIQESQVGSASEFFQTYPTEAEKKSAIKKAWNDLIAKHGTTQEGLIAHYYLGINAADAGDLTEAEKHLKVVADSSKDDYSSQAKLSLSLIYESMGKIAEAEKLLKSVIDNPTIMVSKEQAIIALGRILGRSKPAEARKL
ncbi:MAG: tetratricopeptide repeat protein [Bryobacteraceae bacterium]